MLIIEVLVLLVVAGFVYNYFVSLRQLKDTKPTQSPDNLNSNKPTTYPKDVIGLYEKGYNYETGFGDEYVQDLEKAIEFYTYAAKRGYPAAQYRLATIYYHGKTIRNITIQRDLTKARYWVVKAIEREYPGSDQLYKMIDEIDRLYKHKAQLEQDENVQLKHNHYN